MTVCIAAVCNSATPEGGVKRVAIIAADRMMTAGDIQYEPPMRKMAFISRRVVILVAGDLVIHTEALQATHREIMGKSTGDVEDI